MTAEPIVTLVIPGRPVPWSVPIIGKGASGKGIARKEPRLLAWQKVVELAARKAMAGLGAGPEPGPVAVEAAYSLARRGNPPDLNNLDKALADALQEVVFVNDRQVCAWKSRRMLVASAVGEFTFVKVFRA